MSPAAGLGEDRVGYGKRVKLEAFKGDLLSQHDIAYGELALRGKAQQAGAFAAWRELFNVELIRWWMR